MKQRIISGLIAGVAFYILCILGGYWFSVLVIVAAIAGYDEYMRMMQFKRGRVLYVLGLLGMLAVALPWGHLAMPPAWSWEKVIWLCMLFMLVMTVITKNRVTIDQAASVLLSVIYLGTGFHYILLMRFIEPYGVYWMSLVVLCIIATDSGAYFAGFFWGKHLLWPAISPKKTIEGGIGGLVLAVIVALIFSWAEPNRLTYGQAVLIAVEIAIVGQLGDFIQSAYKRVKGVKDTGAILPGHGGMLDRVDSWLIVFPFVYLFSFIAH